MIGQRELYSAIFEPKSLYYIKSKDSPVQNIQYYNDPEKEEKEKKSKIAMIVLLTVGVLGTIAGGIFAKRGNIEHLIQSAKTTGTAIKNFNIKNETANIMSNTINIKDDYTKKVTDSFKNVPVLKWIDKICQTITNTYHKMMKSSARPQYEKLREQIIKNGGESLNIPKFDEVYDELMTSVSSVLEKDGNRVTDKLFEGDIIKKMTSCNIADKKIANLESVQRAFENVSLDKIENPTEELIKSVKDFNKMKSSLMSVLIPKIRDVAIGSAPTDIESILLSILALGIAIKNEDTQEEKKSTIINLGVPLITTMSMTVLNTAKLISGSKAFILGLFSGQVARFVADKISSLFNKNDNKTV